MRAKVCPHPLSDEIEMICADARLPGG